MLKHVYNLTNESEMIRRCCTSSRRQVGLLFCP